MKLQINALTKDIFSCILFIEKTTVSIPWTLGPYTTAFYFLSVAEGNWKISSVSRDQLMSKILVDGGMSRLSKQDWPAFVLVRVRSLVIIFFKELFAFIFMYTCVCVNYAICVLMLTEGKRECQIPKSWSYRRLWAIWFGFQDSNSDPLEEQGIL